MTTAAISLTKQKDGWWLYDETRRVNLSMRAPSAQAACEEALGYYQQRLLVVEAELTALSMKVEAFVTQFKECEEEGWP